MIKSTLVIDTPKNCGDCPFCIFTAEEKRYIGYCHTSDDDYYCKILDRFMEYDKVDGGVDILGKPTDCPLQVEGSEEEAYSFPEVFGEPIEILVDGVWVQGKVINGYRSRDGIVNMETADGKKYWCGCERTDCYRRPKEGENE